MARLSTLSREVLVFVGGAIALAIAASVYSSTPETDTETAAPAPPAVAPRPGGKPDRLVASQPADGADRVALDPTFRLQFDIPLVASAVEKATYRIEQLDSGAVLNISPTSLTLDLTRNNLSFAAVKRLLPETGYVLTVDGLRAEKGGRIAPVEISFTTTAGQVLSDRFQMTRTFDVDGPTTVAVGPDGRLYVSTFDGSIVRVALGPDGEASAPVETVVSNAAYHFIGLAFDPDDPRLLWVSQWPKAPDDEFGSEIVTYNLATGVETKKVTGLPRHPRGDHSVQSLAFNDGRLYASIGSVTTSGHESFSFWGEPTLREVPVSASIIEIDHQELVRPIEVGGRAVSPDSTPIRLFATGLRNAYDLVWHRNGNMYANINQNGGSDEQSTRTPTDGLCVGLPDSVQTNVLTDTLNLIRRGGYYGHPNPARGECVVMGGGQPPLAVEGYDETQAPEPAFDASLIVSYLSDTGSSLGVSVNGLAEYFGGGPLDGALLSADFAGSRRILTAKPAAADDMTLAEPISALAGPDGAPFTFIHPLDVISTPDGVIHVADFGQWPGDDIGAQGAVYTLTPIPR